MELTTLLLHLVPNAPCGVERVVVPPARFYTVEGFLMHRVELKGWELSLKDRTTLLFLMHRVELKGKPFQYG